MIPGLMDAVSAAIVAGAFGWAAVEARRGRSSASSKLAAIDVLIRGDGNGTVGMAERVRQTQASLAEFRAEFAVHADGEEARIVAVLEERVELIEPPPG